MDATTRQPIRPVVTAPGAFGVIVDPQLHEVWVTNQTANSVSVVDEKTRKTVATFPIGKGPALPAVESGRQDDLRQPTS